MPEPQEISLTVWLEKVLHSCHQVIEGRWSQEMHHGRQCKRGFIIKSLWFNGLLVVTDGHEFDYSIMNHQDWWITLCSNKLRHLVDNLVAVKSCPPHFVKYLSEKLTVKGDWADSASTQSTLTKRYFQSKVQKVIGACLHSRGPSYLLSLLQLAWVCLGLASASPPIELHVCNLYCLSSKNRMLRSFIPLLLIIHSRILSFPAYSTPGKEVMRKPSMYEALSDMRLIMCWKCV